MIILLDQDNVLADFEEGFRSAWTRAYPDIPPVAETDRKSFQVRDDYPAHRPALSQLIVRNKTP